MSDNSKPGREDLTTAEHLQLLYKALADDARIMKQHKAYFLDANARNREEIEAVRQMVYDLQAEFSRHVQQHPPGP